MTTGIDLQARLKDEGDKAYLAYTTYRDLGESRTLSAAYAQYRSQINPPSRVGSKKVSKGPQSEAPSPSFRQWVTEFRWEDRIRDWDDQKLARVQAAQLEKDSKGYAERVEKMRKTLEECGILAATNSKIALATAQGQMNLVSNRSVAKIDGKNQVVKLTQDDRKMLEQMTRVSQMAGNQLTSAALIWKDAMGLGIDSAAAPTLLTIHLTGDVPIDVPDDSDEQQD